MSFVFSHWRLLGAATSILVAPVLSAQESAPASEPQTISGTLDEIEITARLLNEKRAGIQTQTGASTYVIDDAAIAATPGGDNTLLNQVIMQAPDVVQDSFGQFHVRGDHNDLQYRLNGIILPEGISVFGQSLSPRLISSLQLVTGALPAEYGLRTAGIIDMTTKSGALDPGGTISLYGGSHGTFQPSFDYGGNSGNLNYFVSGDLLRNSLGIESPDGRATALHDHSTQYHGFGYFENILDSRDRLSLILGTSNDRFQIPDRSGLQPDSGLSVNGQTLFPSAALDQNQRELTSYAIASWQHTQDALDWQSSVTARYSSLTYSPDPVGDLLYNGISQRAFKNDTALGWQTDAAYQFNAAHTIRAGFYLQHDRANSDTTAQVLATGDVDGFAIFHLIPGAQEAVVPLETRNAGSYLLAFDNTNGVVLAVAVANVSAQAANIPVIVRDSTGAQIATGTIALPGNGHKAFVLSSAAAGFPVTANTTGTVEFDTPAGGQITVLGIRTTPLPSGTSNTITTVPALANVGTNGGSFPFLAAGGDGWQTTFVLVNAGTTPASATLSFYDPNGHSQALPVSYPQTGPAITSVSSITQNLAAGASLTVLSAGTPASLAEGSAQLTTSGNVSGFAVFRRTTTFQEAVVPMESRNAPAYLLAYDNTNGIATGISVSNVTAGAGNVIVPVTTRDDMGNVLGTHSLTLNPNGEFSGNPGTAMLWPEVANLRGTIEFDAPAGAQIGVLGIRTPPTIGGATTYTTLPALTKP